MQLTSFKCGTATEEEYAALARFEQLIRQERMPDEPLIAAALLINVWKNMPDFVDYRAWALWDSAQIIGCGMLHMLLLDTNQHVADLNLAVLPAYRGQGLARSLLQAIQPVLVEAERNVIIGSTTQSVAAGELFAQKIGAEARLKPMLINWPWLSLIKNCFGNGLRLANN